MSANFKARRLRRDSTNVERLLWKHLRNRQLVGFKFRRQSPIGPYIVDFECFAAKLVIELDGSQHQNQVNYDGERTQYLEMSGYRVLRFWNNDVYGDIEAVTQSILAALESRVPSPPGRGLE